MSADTAMERRALAALLDWYLAAGVDIAVDDAPHDRFAESARPESSAPAAEAVASEPALSSPAPRRAASAPPLRSGPSDHSRNGVVPAFPEEAARAAKEAAASAADLAELRQRLETFDGCALKATAGHFIFAAGTPGARLMVLDFSPGEEEERGGEAFVGPRARLLDNMLKAIGLGRESAYLAYATPWRPPGERELNASETAALLPFLQKHVELAAPEVLLILGDATARAALGANDVARLRGQWFDYACETKSVRALLSLSLGNLLKTPILKRNAWRDLRAVASALK